MLRQILIVLLALVGVGLVVAGLSWKLLRPRQAYWSEEQAQEYNDAFLAAKAAALSDTRRLNQPDDPQLVAARQRWEESQADLDRAVAARGRTGPFVAAAGVAILALAAYVHRNRPPKTEADLPPLHLRSD